MGPPTSKKLVVTDSPFIDLQSPFTAYEALKLVLLLPLLVPRLLICVVTVCVVALINSIAAYNWPVDKPLTKTRRAAVLFSKELLVVVFFFLGFRVRVKGRENIQLAEQLGAVAIFNHVSWLDAFVAVWLMAPSGVAKEFNAHLPVIKHCVRALQTVYIPSSRASKISTDKQEQKDDPTTVGSEKAIVVDAYVATSSVTEVLQKRVNDKMYCKPGGFPITVMAPEGTCGNGKCILEFRTGAFVLGRPILPICLHYKFKHCNPAWTIVPHEVWHFVRIITQFINILDVTILPPYVPSAAELADGKLYANNMRKVMSDTMGLPLVSVGHEQYLALKKLKVGVSWDGRRVTAPPGVIVDGLVDLDTHVKHE